MNTNSATNLATEKNTDRTVSKVFVEARKRSPDLAAFTYFDNGAWKNISWSDYYKMAERVACGLKSLGLKPGDRVAIMSNTRYNWAVTDQGVLGMGCITVPIYQSSTPEDVEFILNNCEATAVFVEDANQLSKLKSLKQRPASLKHVISFLDTSDKGIKTWQELQDLGQAYHKENPTFFEESCQNVRASDIATIVYTSGTTGTPKGAAITHTAIDSECSEIMPILDLSEKDTTVTFLPFAHIFGRVEMWAHTYIGWNMGFAESIEKISANLVDLKPTFMLAVPRIFEKIYAKIIGQVDAGSPIKKKLFYWALGVGRQVSKARQNREDLPLTLLVQFQLANKLVFSKIYAKLGGRIRYLVSGGAPLPREIAEFFHAAGILILEGYGLTETTAAVFVNTPYHYKFGTVGKSIGEVQVKIAEDGEILVRSKKVFKEYFKNPEATSEVFNDGWFCTGDIGEIDKDGFLRITDRKKDLIKTSGGKMIAPQKLENTLKTSKYVSQVVVYGDQKKYLVALITLNQEEVVRFAENEGIKETSLEALSKNEKVIALINEVVREKNSTLASYETIKKFLLLPIDFTVENGALTPSLKVKRKVLSARYEKEIQSLYQ